MTMRKLDPERAAELAALRERIVLTIRFLNDKEGIGELGRGLVEVADSAFSKRDLRAMRLLARQVDQFTIALKPHHREGLEAVLRQRLGIDKDAERSELKQRVAKALERGVIISEKERRRLEDYVEMLEATGGDPAEVEAVRRLLSM